jgi:hypothetical protein
MKKTVIILLFVFTAHLVSAFSGKKEKEVDPAILASFQKEFSFAKNVKWEISGGLTKAYFSLNEQGFLALYNEDSELVSVARNILYMQLPLSVIKGLDADYADADLTGITEITKGNETVYLVTAERKGKKFLLKAASTGNITVVKRIK